MKNDDTVAKLARLSTPKAFPQHSYICIEGEPGDEMYIVLKGLVGVYINNACDTLVEAAKIGPGDFFGEMAVFDSEPRSASCIALEDTVCAAVKRDKLEAFVKDCPELTVKFLENLSGRIRKLDEELYKSAERAESRDIPFEVPAEFRVRHDVKPTAPSPAFTEEFNAACPICGKVMTAVNVKRGIMKTAPMEDSGRIRYTDHEPMWNEVWSCPHCHYSNYYLRFFKLPKFQRKAIEDILTKRQRSVVDGTSPETPFDRLAMTYLQAIHINESINSSDNLLIGKLWQHLHWLSEDAGDEEMSLYCARKAVSSLKIALDGGEIKDDLSKDRYMLMIADLFNITGNPSEAEEMYSRALYCDSEDIRRIAYKMKNKV